MDFLLFLSYVILALFDLIALEIILSLIFVIDEKGRIKYTFNYILGKPKSKSIWIYVSSLIFLGVLYFFLANLYQDTITEFMISFFGYYLILLFISALSLVAFWIIKFYIGRKMTSWQALTTLIVFIISTLDLIIILVIRYGGVNS